MSSYKVPQDVEADDKLIGPFSFRQFIYLIIVAIAGGLAYGLGRLFIPLAIIPLPIILFFGALALPLKKDQPMEIYLAAIVTFYLKPRKRFWQPDGIQSLIEITAPNIDEVIRSKDLSQDEAEKRFSYLASIMDTGGWSVRGVDVPQSSSMKSQAFYEAKGTEDVLDGNGGVAQSFDDRLNQSDTRHHEEVLARIRRPSMPDPYASLSAQPAAPQSSADDPKIVYNPYPTSIKQAVIQPIDPNQPAPTRPQPAQQPATPTRPQPIQPTTSEKPVSPDIMDLANNSDLSIETIAHEAQRIQEKHALAEKDEVVISLR